MNAMSEAQCLLKIIKYILVPDTDICEISVTDWNDMVSLARKNGVFQYLYRYMKQLPGESKPPEEIAGLMEQLNARELRAGILQEYALDKLKKGLEEAGVDHMFVKGSVTKERYPDRYLRSMGDIDLLYRAEQHDALREKMTELGFAVKHIGRVHDLYADQAKIIVEVHRQLVSSESPYYSFCEGAWSRAVKNDGTQHGYAMRIEDEFLFNFMHLASHFKKGGVGIRFVVDVWIYKQLEMDREYVRKILSDHGLVRFYDAIDSLTEKWFGHVEETHGLVDEIERYILSGGIFGNRENRKNAAIRNGRLRSFFKACFPSYREMQSMFPKLKCKAMLPFAWLCRIFGSLTKRRGNVKILLSPIKNGDRDAAAQIKRFLEKCGLE